MHVSHDAALSAQTSERIAKEQLCDLLRKFVCQRPGFEFGNYATLADYRADCRRVAKDRSDALAMIQACEYRPEVTAAMLRDKLHPSQRLHLYTNGKGFLALDYTAGQYWCVEYRAAVCRALSNVLWDAWRTETTTRAGIQSMAALAVGRSIARRWLN